MRARSGFDHFKLLVTRPDRAASPAVYVAVNCYFVPDESANRGEICLSFDTISPNELNAEVDKLIAELQGLKKQARRVFARETARPA